jgi:hypothetical protein
MDPSMVALGGFLSPASGIRRRRDKLGDEAV